ncbi:DUF2069 domain-containing protein [Salinicola rhizosphaerae]|uniref:DUF2069 domain-containing protein n=1 Tax=Salinicola rhizosphaerae TaxID=1443141 RepID=A0ABQ3DNF4_9GAMM|nr:DUF2069 domain-containing protein [Salinicola rhizosphaerae]GHB09078.1 hypothetical protein GCM10009038_03290 [Salinicola rhizosphaerae]
MTSDATPDLGSAQRAVWITYLALLVLLIVSGVSHYLQQHAQLAALLVRALPLILFLPTLLLARRRGYIWLALVGGLYVLQGILIVSKGGGSILVMLEIAAAVGLAITSARCAKRCPRPQRRS